MRPLIALLVSVSLLVGAYGYIRFTDSVRQEPLEIVPTYSSEHFSVRITKTFTAAGDPDFDVDALLVRFRGDVILTRTDEIPAEELIEIDPLPNVEEMANELFVEANLKQDEDAWGKETFQALRVEVLQGDHVVADQSFWLEPGSESIAGTVSFDAPGESAPAHSHD